MTLCHLCGHPAVNAARDYIACGLYNLWMRQSNLQFNWWSRDENDDVRQRNNGPEWFYVVALMQQRVQALSRRQPPTYTYPYAGLILHQLYANRLSRLFGDHTKLQRLLWKTEASLNLSLGLLFLTPSTPRPRNCRVDRMHHRRLGHDVSISKTRSRENLKYKCTTILTFRYMNIITVLKIILLNSVSVFTNSSTQCGGVTSERLVSSTSRGPSQLNILHLPLQAFTARDGARYCSESRFLRTPPAFDAPVKLVPVGISP